MRWRAAVQPWSRRRYCGSATWRSICWRGIARRRGQKIELLPREFKLLEYLARNVGQVVSRAMLLQHVWDLHFDPTTNVIDVYVGRVRRKIDNGQAYPLIHTIRGVGFCLRAPE